MVKGNIFIFIFFSVLASCAENTIQCTKSTLLITKKIKLIRYSGEECRKSGLFVLPIKSIRKKVKVDGERFENIFFLNLPKDSMFAIFTGTGAHTHVVSFFRQDNAGKLEKIKDAVFGSGVGEPCLQYDPLGAEYKFAIKTRSVKDVSSGKRFCRVLLENMYIYTNDKFKTKYKNKELTRECFPQ